jgi:hypothetical protein
MARYLGGKFYRGEQYYLQIDSHSEFIQDWDAHLIQMVEDAPAEKPVISTYPPDSSMKWQVCSCGARGGERLPSTRYINDLTSTRLHSLYSYLLYLLHLFRIISQHNILFNILTSCLTSSRITGNPRLPHVRLRFRHLHDRVADHPPLPL